MKKINPKWLRITLSILMWGCVAVAVFGIAINLIVTFYASRRIVAAQDAEPAQCIIVLGARVRGEEPSSMLQDRLDKGLELYRLGKAPKLLVSGDHGRTDYDEVNAMRKYLEERGVPAEDIFMDHAGFDTYSTMYRARDVFQVESAIVVTQKYHLSRAVYIASRLGLQAQGVVCDVYVPKKIVYYTMREWLARIKDFLGVELFHPLPQYLGDPIPITGDGRATEG